MKNTILELVVTENYEQAMSKLKGYVEHGNPDYYVFRKRAGKYLTFCDELIKAIEAKRGLSRHKSLSATQTKELQDNYNLHFRQLTNALNRMERIERSLKIEDLSSTVILVKAAQFSVAVLFLGGLYLELRGGLLSNIAFLASDTFFRISITLADWIAN